MQHRIIVTADYPRPRSGTTACSPIVRLIEWAHACADRRAQRRALADLDDRLLHDIGRTRSDAAAETAKPCWRR